MNPLGSGELGWRTRMSYLHGTDCGMYCRCPARRLSFGDVDLAADFFLERLLMARSDVRFIGTSLRQS